MRLARKPDTLSARAQIDGLQHVLAFVAAQVQVGRHQVGQRTGRGAGLHRRDQGLGHLRQQLQRLHGLALQVDQARFDFGTLLLGLFDGLHLRRKKGLLAHEMIHPKALQTLHHQMVAAVGHVHVAQDVGDRAHAMQVARAGLGLLGIALHQDADGPLLAQRLLGGEHRRFAADGHRKHRAGKQHRVTHGDDHQRVACRAAGGRLRTLPRSWGRCGHLGGRVVGSGQWPRSICAGVAHAAFSRLMTRQPRSLLTCDPA